MYLLTAVSHDGEVLLMQITDEKTIGKVINNVMSAPRSIHISVTRLSEDNVKRNFTKSKKNRLIVSTNTDTPKQLLAIPMTQPNTLLQIE